MRPYPPRHRLPPKGERHMSLLIEQARRLAQSHLEATKLAQQ